MDINLLDVAATAALIGFGFLIGVPVGRRRAAKPTIAEAICPCTHGINFHKNMTGKCNAQDRVTKYDRSGWTAGKMYTACACLHYAGPELVNAMTMRPILPLNPPRKDD